MAKVKTSVLIDRPVGEVFSYVADPDQVAQWAGPVVESTKTSEGPVGVGTTSTRVTQFLGRTIEATHEITEFDPDSVYADRTTSGPVPIHSRILFEAADGGTKVTIEGELQAAGFFKIAEPVMLRVARRQVETDAQNLKEILEAK